MKHLPEVSKEQAIIYNYFPTTWQAVLWRNWGYVSAERIAEALKAEVEDIKKWQSY